MSESNISYSNTYVLFESCPRYFNFDRLRGYLNNFGLKEVSYEEGSEIMPKFVWFRYIITNNIDITNKYLYYPIYCMNNIIKVDSITNKLNLYNNMKKIFPEEYLLFMPESFKLTEDTLYKYGDIIITKPTVNRETGLMASSGKDIIICNSNETLNLAKNNLKNYHEILASKYITEPLLFKEKKFHLRTYMAITLFDGMLSCHLLKTARIWHAKNKYKNSDYQNKLIHDTHYDSCDDDYLFPDDMCDILNEKQIEDVFQQIENICGKMAFILDKNLYPKQNVEYAFHIFGFDLMIDEKINVWLLECNRYLQMGLDYNDEKRVKFENIFFDWINDIVIKPVFGKE